MRSQTFWRRLVAAVGVSCAIAALLAGAAQAHDTTFTAWYKGTEPSWLIPAMNASVAESYQLIKRWSNTNTAYWDVYGVRVFMGTRSQLDAMGQKKVEHELWANCDDGIHLYTPGAVSWSGPYPSRIPTRS